VGSGSRKPLKSPMSIALHFSSDQERVKKRIFQKSLKHPYFWVKWFKPNTTSEAKILRVCEGKSFGLGVAELWRNSHADWLYRSEAPSFNARQFCHLCTEKEDDKKFNRGLNLFICLNKNCRLAAIFKVKFHAKFNRQPMNFLIEFLSMTGM